jgi:hypothetical protein
MSLIYFIIIAPHLTTALLIPNPSVSGKYCRSRIECRYYDATTGAWDPYVTWQYCANICGSIYNGNDDSMSSW